VICRIPGRAVRVPDKFQINGRYATEILHRDIHRSALFRAERAIKGDRLLNLSRIIVENGGTFAHGVSNGGIKAKANRKARELSTGLK
jgi:hypothetical protein